MTHRTTLGWQINQAHRSYLINSAQDRTESLARIQRDNVKQRVPGSVAVVSKGVDVLRPLPL